VLCVLCGQSKHKASRRCTNAVVKIIRALLPAGHHFPRNVWSALRCGTQANGLTHREIAFCAGAIMPAQTNRKETLCNNPTVYYGQWTDEHGTTRSKESLANCMACGGSEKKITYLITIEQHIQVNPWHKHTHTSHTHSSHAASMQVARATFSDVHLCCRWLQNLWRRRDLQDDLQLSFKNWKLPTGSAYHIPVMRDVVDSPKFANRCGAFVSGAGYRNVVLMLYADGVSVADRRDNSMFIISAQVVNLPPDKRRQLSNMLLLQIIPGPKTPSSLRDLLQPLVDELKSLYLHGVNIDIGGGEIINIKAMFITISADSRAHPKLTMMKQTPAKYPCHLCKLKVAPHTHHRTGTAAMKAACSLHAGSTAGPRLTATALLVHAGKDPRSRGSGTSRRRRSAGYRGGEGRESCGGEGGESRCGR
jgi:hypothetical protein